MFARLAQRNEKHSGLAGPTNRARRCSIGLIFCLMCPIPALSGPFGLEMGQSLDGLEIESESDQNMALTFKPPKAHSRFHIYGLIHHPDYGLCQIRALGKEIESSRYGTELKSEFERIAEQLKGVYGAYETKDFLRYGSIWDEPDEWMMGLKQKERVLQASWDKDSGARLKDNITEILLHTTADSGNEGQLALQYSFTNTDACLAAIEQGESDAF